MKQAAPAIIIQQRDNVAVALAPIAAGVTFEGVTALEAIPQGHKMALSPIETGEDVVKYGFPIGRATAAIPPGAHIHTHNLRTALQGQIAYEYAPNFMPIPEPTRPLTFDGFLREDGQVGIRNEVWIINTVGCVNKIAEKIAQTAETLAGSIPEIDGIFTFVHPWGCSQLGDDHLMTQQVLAGLVHNPNAAGVLVLGLGCENNHIDEFKKVLGNYDENRVKFLNTQDVDDEITVGVQLVTDLVAYAAGFTRTPQPLSKLVVGLKCGGSDGLSGITANALTGLFTDTLTAHGGTCILTEVPEMFGAETILMNRCADESVYNETVKLINNFKAYYEAHNQPIYENPSPGNKDGGITTLEEKSLGCTQKGGSAIVTDVLHYGERVRKTGLVLLQGPGNDIVAVTNLTAAGAQLIIFTTGRGTPLGAPVPTVKVSSNTTLATTKPHWTDFNAGQMLASDNTAEEFLQYIIQVAEGRETTNELNGYREISIFKNGVTL